MCHCAKDFVNVKNVNGLHKKPERRSRITRTRAAGFAWTGSLGLAMIAGAAGRDGDAMGRIAGLGGRLVFTSVVAAKQP
jgi:hypothetical protein